MLRMIPFLPFKLLYSAFFTVLILVPEASTANKVDNNESVRVKPGASSIGNYLAGRHAQARHDMGAAVTFLEAALRAMPDVPDLRRRTFILLVTEGRIKEALPLAKKVLKDYPKAPIAKLTLAVEALRSGKYAAVAAQFEDGADKGLNSFTRSFMKAWALAGDGKSGEAQKALAKLDGNESTQGLYDVHLALLLDFMDDPGADAAIGDG